MDDTEVPFNNPAPERPAAAGSKKPLGALATVTILFAVSTVSFVLGRQSVYIQNKKPPVGYETPTPGEENKVACTMEAKLCPDGTAVGRVPPKCEFEPCPNPTQVILRKIDPMLQRSLDNMKDTDKLEVLVYFAPSPDLEKYPTEIGEDPGLWGAPDRRAGSSNDPKIRAIVDSFLAKLSAEGYVGEADYTIPLVKVVLPKSMVFQIAAWPEVNAIGQDLIMQNLNTAD